MTDRLPHDDVYVRLGISRIEGIGVFAIRPIPEGTNIFANDRIEIVWVAAEDVEKSAPTPGQRAFYEDFAIRRDGRLGCPVNFHNLTPGWYCNQPAEGDDPNVRVEEDFSFYAARDIAEGEELTIRYDQFSDPHEAG
jgi:hypothetical protein